MQVGTSMLPIGLTSQRKIRLFLEHTFPCILKALWTIQVFLKADTKELGAYMSCILDVFQ